jgi:hypothetical protein
MFIGWQITIAIKFNSRNTLIQRSVANGRENEMRLFAVVYPLGELAQNFGKQRLRFKLKVGSKLIG